MTNELQYSLQYSELSEQSSVELTYPRIPVFASFVKLLCYSTLTNMVHESRSDNRSTALSESWATLSDADYSLDDDLRSETTDAVSLVENAGSDDVHSIDEQPSDGGSQDAYSDEDVHPGLPPQNHSIGTGSVGALKESRLGRPIALEMLESQTETEFAEATQVIHSFSDVEVKRITEYTSSATEYDQFVGRICMKMSKNSLTLDSPFRLLYIGDASARAEILTKMGDVLVAGSETQRGRSRLDSSRYHVFLPSDALDSSPNPPDLIPIRTQIIVDDCTTAASIKHEQAPDQIFLSFKNGSLYSSRWNGTTYKISSASEWSSPDLAVFFVADGDDSVSKQRHQLAHAFVSRHRIPALVISETTSWDSPLDTLPIDHCSPHLRIEAQKMHVSRDTVTLRRLPIDLEIFGCLKSEQLNKNFAYLRQNASNELNVNTSRPSSTPSHASRDKSSAWSPNASCQSSPKPNTLYSLCTDTPVMGTIILAAGGLMSLAMTVIACKLTLALFMYLVSHSGHVSELSPATSWSFQPLSAPTNLEAAPSTIQTAGAAAVTSNESVWRSLAAVDTPSVLTEVVASKSLQAKNQSENFQIHSIGDCHIVIKTPRGFKVRNKSTPFDVVVSRGSEVLDSTLSKLFDGVYTVRVDRDEAYGLLNVTIRRHQSSTLEEHQINFGAQWLTVAGWKKAAQAASEQVRTDLDRAQTALSVAYDHLSQKVHFKSKDVSKTAARQARKFSRQSGLVLNATTTLLKTKSKELWDATNHERQKAYKVLSKQADLAFQGLVVRTHTPNEWGHAIIKRLLISADRRAKQIQQSAPKIELADVQNKMQDYLRSERLAKAQERAKQIVKDTSTSWRQRRTSRRARRAKRAGCDKKSQGCNRR